MEDLTMIVFTVYAVGFGLGLCGLGLLAAVGWPDDRERDEGAHDDGRARP